ncbi:MAG: hypothetical protein Q7T82_00255 [Armatimonadota bacterium]|nr:hypothetical protein [Armatimonadota bacterium]
MDAVYSGLGGYGDRYRGPITIREVGSHNYAVRAVDFAGNQSRAIEGWIVIEKPAAAPSPEPVQNPYTPPSKPGGNVTPPAPVAPLPAPAPPPVPQKPPVTRAPAPVQNPPDEPTKQPTNQPAPAPAPVPDKPLPDTSVQAPTQPPPDKEEQQAPRPQVY